MERDPGPDPHPRGLHGGTVPLVVVGVTLVIGALPVLLTVTTVAVAIDAIAARFEVSAGIVHWVATAYLLAITAVIPTLGWLVDRFGARRVWFAALGSFLTGSLLCAAAWSLGSLITFRVVQGLGGGLILPLLQTVLAQRAGPAGFPRAMALVAVPGQLVPILGPVIGGALVDGPGWRWIFLLNVPLALAALLLACIGLPPIPPRGSIGPLDVTGLAVLVPGFVALMYALSATGQTGRLAGSHGGWLVVGVALLATYVLRALRQGRSGPVELRLLRHGPLRAATGVTLMLGVCLWGSMLLLPLYLQQARGASGIDTGLVLAPQGLGTLAGLLTVGRLVERAGPRRVAVAGLGIAAVATLPFALAATQPTDLVLATALFVRGVGLGVAGVPALSAAYAHLPEDDLPAATVIVSIAQRLGAAIGTAALAVALDRHLVGGPDHAAAFGRTFAWTALLTLLAAALAGHLPARAVASRSSAGPPLDAPPPEHLRKEHPCPPGSTPC